MGWLQPTHLIVVLIAISSTISLFGFLSNALSQRKRRQARGFAIGLACGLLAGRLLRQPSKYTRILGVVTTTRTNDLRSQVTSWTDVGSLALRRLANTVLFVRPRTYPPR